MSDRPDWLIIGQQHPDGGVVVLASRSMTGQAHIREESSSRRGDSIDFRVGMADYLKVEASTYAEALADLFGQWAPNGGDPFQALEGGSGGER